MAFSARVSAPETRTLSTGEPSRGEIVRHFDEPVEIDYFVPYRSSEIELVSWCPYTKGLSNEYLMGTEKKRTPIFDLRKKNPSDLQNALLVTRCDDVTDPQHVVFS